MERVSVRVWTIHNGLPRVHFVHTRNDGARRTGIKIIYPLKGENNVGWAFSPTFKTRINTNKK